MEVPKCPEWVIECYALNILEQNLSSMCLAPVMEHYLALNGYTHADDVIVISEAALDGLELNPCAGVDFVGFDDIRLVSDSQVCLIVK